LSLLDKIPVWKQLKELPQKVESLEKRVAELEKNPASTDDICPKCKNNSYELISTKPHKHLGIVGVKDRLYRCSQCGFEEIKTVEP
jgi:predicted nucleic-acid-binding Zn-ribbon protein